MNIAEESSSRLVLADSSRVIAAIALSFSLIGFAFLYQIIAGESDDYFGATIGILFPALSAFALIRNKTTTFDKINRSVIIEENALFKPSAPIEVEFSYIKEAKIIRPKGGVPGPAHMQTKIVLACKDRNISILSMGSRIPKPAKTREIIEKINRALSDA